MSTAALTDERLSALEKKLGHQFERRELLVTALTHSSWANEQKGENPNYERLEFLGDAVLGLVISDLLFRRGDEPEGVLTQAKNLLVSANTLSDLASALGLGNYLLLGQGEELGAGRNKPSLLANVMESVIGALYVDGGYSLARRFIKKLFTPLLEEVASGGRRTIDHKSALQELLQAQRLPTPNYLVCEELGPPHQRTFTVSLTVNGREWSRGQGNSKKTAEQEAARLLLASIESGDVRLDNLS